MSINTNYGSTMGFQGLQQMGGGFQQPNPGFQMMAQMMKMMMTMLMRLMGGGGQLGGCGCSGNGMSPMSGQSPSFGMSQGSGFGGGNPMDNFLGNQGHSGNFGGGSPFGASGNFGNAGGGNPLGNTGGHQSFGGPSSAGQGGFQSSGNAGHPLSPKAVNMIAKAEGFDQPGKWPGYKSGITIGVGYDLAHKTRDQLYRDWKGKIPDAQLARLSGAIGLKGQAAKAASGQFRDINIPKNAALDVFHNTTLPRFYNQAKKAFPGLERLPRDAQGALTSLVFNRGAGMKGARRSEMRQIRGAVANYQGSQSLNYIAGRVQSMKRLWVGQGVNGLLRRRDTEANMIRNSAYS